MLSTFTLEAWIFILRKWSSDPPYQVKSQISIIPARPTSSLPITSSPTRRCRSRRIAIASETGAAVSLHHLEKYASPQMQSLMTAVCRTRLITRPGSTPWRSCPPRHLCSCSAAATVKPIGCPRWHGPFSEKRLWDGRAFRRSVILCMRIPALDTSMPG